MDRKSCGKAVQKKSKYWKQKLAKKIRFQNISKNEAVRNIPETFEFPFVYPEFEVCA